MTLFTKTGNSIYNDDVRRFLAKEIQLLFSNEMYSSMVNPQEYCDTFVQWIKSSKNNRIVGVDTFPHLTTSLGVTQALDQFHYEILLKGQRLRIFRGEYPYSRDVHPFHWSTDFIDDSPLKKGDAVVISCPFSGSGSQHPRMEETLNTCLELNIPVFVDMAWFGTCAGLNVDLGHPAIQYVGFSLSKGLTCGNYRSGLRLARSAQPKDRLNLQFEWNHGTHLNNKIGTLLMKKFGPDTQFEKYRSVQEKICKKNNLTPSLCVHIATGDSFWNEFSRDGVYNRINLREAIKNEMKGPS